MKTASRKQHNTEPGYIAERMNPLVPGRKVVIYEASVQGIDAWGNRYAVVCDEHAQIGAAVSLPKARALMKHPGDFCLSCRELTG